MTRKTKDIINSWEKELTKQKRFATMKIAGLLGAMLTFLVFVFITVFQVSDFVITLLLGK